MIDRILDRLGRLHPKVIDLSLDRVRALLARLGNPQDRLPDVIHVAGTNGKGSTVATLRAILEAAGKRVHVYTSPHLVRFAERVRIAGHLPSDDQLEALLEEVERVNDGAPITFFEVTTAAAFLAFARTPADAVILETGLGGRLDATNVVDRPAATVIAPIDMDHQQFLGDSLTAIAGEKAGILKAGVPCVSARQLPDAAHVLTQRADALGCDLLMEGTDFTVTARSGGRMHYLGPTLDLDLPQPNLPGDFQHHNAALAIAALEAAGLAPALPVIARGLHSIQWPARLQRLTHGPLVAAAPKGWEVWLDGGHNPHAAQAIATHARTHWAGQPLHALFGILANKDVDGYMSILAPHLTRLRAVAIPGEANSLGAGDAAQAASRHGCRDAKDCTDPDSAMAQLAENTPPTGRILICGSLYLAGYVLASNG